MGNRLIKVDHIVKGFDFIKMMYSKNPQYIDKHYTKLLFRKNNKNVGFLIYSYSNSKNIHIQALEIKKEFRGQGYGKWFLNKFFDKHKGVMVRLNSVPESEGFYFNMGFKKSIFGKFYKEL